jgi:hypothetical protein
VWVGATAEATDVVRKPPSPPDDAIENARDVLSDHVNEQKREDSSNG